MNMWIIYIVLKVVSHLHENFKLLEAIDIFDTTVDHFHIMWIIKYFDLLVNWIVY